MPETKFLYGASIQGIQSFIFQTNKLKEIVGGSELVEEICTTSFYEFIDPDGKGEEDSNIIISAAGNIKFIANEGLCRRLVRDFPKLVLEKAPGVTISQAVVKIDEELTLAEQISQLEEKLKAERNRPAKPQEIGFMGLERARRTGGVAVKTKKRRGKEIVFCESTDKKDEVVVRRPNSFEMVSHTKLFYKISGLMQPPKEITLEVEDLCKGHKNSWIAVVHADGNGLGNILQALGQKLRGQDFSKSKAAFRQFSLALDKATQAAAREAFADVFKEPRNYTSEGRYPIRPIICGGDDITFIIRADIALRYTDVFLHAFEKQSKIYLNEALATYGVDTFSEGITACAGIAFVKESYPLHYALHLAEDLCKDAKKMVKSGERIPIRANGIPESALAFYKVQESFTDKINSLKERTLLASQGDKKLDFYYGPYLLDDLKILNERLEILKQEVDNAQGQTKAIGKLRKVVSDCFRDFNIAKFNLMRMEQVNSELFKALELKDEVEKLGRVEQGNEGEKSQLLDLISLHGFNYGTREN
ncbi:hypothetical protein A3SI_19641 [Nitritalea halalkaliphila LW7]|uniref:Cas10/Cmr2 second palm domain-containing protein n=1 Tax=Nitritalea halalkaliphila LW7 TaxID=1189621 RepID=I5BSL8_9BACT|nr:hypothetical protein [Nitritalea halalkaliphila]EIM72570.1 hypothetical protein A3SI_19641 [Nitritalea halalkaliphila LW7]